MDVGRENLPLTSNLFYTVNGVPFSNYKYVKLVEGSPYFNDSFMRGRIIMSKGSIYDSIAVRIYQFDHSLYMELDPIPTPVWYQLLDSGRVILYKKYVKTINEEKPYNSAILEQKMVTSYTYALKVNNVLFPVKKLKDLPNLLQDKRQELTTFIQIKSLSGRSEVNYIDLISYYNSFFTK